jgi:hypothetical protein
MWDFEGKTPVNKKDNVSATTMFQSSRIDLVAPQCYFVLKLTYGLSPPKKARNSVFQTSTAYFLLLGEIAKPLNQEKIYS